MTSAIDATIPVRDTPAAADPIRANFAAAKAEIEALQQRHYCTASIYESYMTGTYGLLVVPFCIFVSGTTNMCDFANSGLRIPQGQGGIYSVNVQITADYSDPMEFSLWTISMRINGAIRRSVQGNMMSPQGMPLTAILIDPVVTLSAGDLITVTAEYFKTQEGDLALSVWDAQTFATLAKLDP